MSSRDLPMRAAEHIDGLVYHSVQPCLVAGGQDSIAGSSWYVGLVSRSSIEPPHGIVLVHLDVFENSRVR